MFGVTATYITKCRYRKVNSLRNPPGGWDVKNEFLENASTCSVISVMKSILEIRTSKAEVIPTNNHDA
jgi:hypothetical protein